METEWGLVLGSSCFCDMLFHVAHKRASGRPGMAAANPTLLCYLCCPSMAICPAPVLCCVTGHAHAGLTTCMPCFSSVLRIQDVSTLPCNVS